MNNDILFRIYHSITKLPKPSVLNTWLCSYVISLLVIGHLLYQQSNKLCIWWSIMITCCKFQINSTHIYINPKGGWPCKERHKHVLLSMNRSNYATKLQLKYSLITPFDWWLFNFSYPRIWKRWFFFHL